MVAGAVIVPIAVRIHLDAVAATVVIVRFAAGKVRVADVFEVIEIADSLVDPLESVGHELMTAEPNAIVSSDRIGARLLRAVLDPCNVLLAKTVISHVVAVISHIGPIDRADLVGRPSIEVVVRRVIRAEGAIADVVSAASFVRRHSGDGSRRHVVAGLRVDVSAVDVVVVFAARR